MSDVFAGCGLSLLERQEETQCDHCAAAVSGVLPEHSDPEHPSGHGGHHQRSHTEGLKFINEYSRLLWIKDALSIQHTGDVQID